MMGKGMIEDFLKIVFHDSVWGKGVWSVQYKGSKLKGNLWYVVVILDLTEYKYY